MQNLPDIAIEDMRTVLVPSTIVVAVAVAVSSKRELLSVAADRELYVSDPDRPLCKDSASESCPPESSKK